MRELNLQEIESVSGAGFLADIGKGIGSTIGSLVDVGAGLFGLTTTVSAAGGLLGSGLGSLLEFNFSSALSGIASGITGLVITGIDAIGQITGNKSA